METYEIEYEKLLRNTYEKPQFVKPKLGRRPEWIDDAKTEFFPVKDLIRQIRGSNTDAKRRSCISRFQTAYIDILKSYYEKGSNPERKYELFLNTKVIRDLFLDFVEVISETETDYAEVLTDFFETSIFGGAVKQNNYTAFRHHSRVVEELYKPNTDMKNKFTLMGDTICNQREKLPIFTSEAIAEADLFLYQVCNA